MPHQQGGLTSGKNCIIKSTPYWRVLKKTSFNQRICKRKSLVESCKEKARFK